MTDHLPGNIHCRFGPDTLLFGIGNSGREDDGLGWAFLDRVEQETDFPGRLEYRYQLQVEDAELVSRADRVIFVDSFRGKLPGGFQWKPCEPAADGQFTSYVLPPGAVLYLCRDLYRKSPPASLLLIQGSDWGLQNGMSGVAEHNLECALRFFREKQFPHTAESSVRVGKPEQLNAEHQG